MLTKTRTLYSVISAEMIIDEGEKQLYGIEVLTDDEKIFTVNDISVCKEFVQNLVEIFNKNDLSPYHIYDVLSDLL